MHTSSPTLPVERIGRTAAERAGRDAASTFLAICTEPPAGAEADMIAWSVMRAYITPYTGDDETAAILRAVLAELDRVTGQ